MSSIHCFTHRVIQYTKPWLYRVMTRETVYCILSKRDSMRQYAAVSMSRYVLHVTDKVSWNVKKIRRCENSGVQSWQLWCCAVNSIKIAWKSDLRSDQKMLSKSSKVVRALYGTVKLSDLGSVRRSAWLGIKLSIGDRFRSDATTRVNAAFDEE